MLALFITLCIVSLIISIIAGLSAVSEYAAKQKVRARRARVIWLWAFPVGWVFLLISMLVIYIQGDD